MRNVVILGSTGSIGSQAVEVIRENRDKFNIVGIAIGGANPKSAIEQAQEFGLSADQIAVRNIEGAKEVSRALGGYVITGENSAAALVESQEADVVLNALVGASGLPATMAALRSDATLALANKESLVAGGRIVLDAAKPGQIVPVDSEHSAMAQCMRGTRRSEIARLVLTASGGPFRGWEREGLMEVTTEEAVVHPTWSMGTMNTINSSTLVNKGLELIEAAMLFDMDPDKIDVTIHPQSVIHSLVTFTDGATLAQASPPSMKLPIAHALDWPNRVPDVQEPLDFSQAFSWEFEPLDNEVFPAVRLAREVTKKGDPYPAIYNAANEAAVEAFFAGRIKFPEIVDIIGEVLDEADEFAAVPSDVFDVMRVESRTRERVAAAIARIER
ncbi:1-deoxy-D-xylulose-5-phosphate reductoisomerase [Corynebacterium sp. HMSC05C01]|uniref:1-deoxy-D-xylulose 5-phosphate reductoisomerase n=1 Tax=Corynebacterium coyleae TaxID=53374 RepID=A0AAP7CB73_9CORY|nr:MULTISPECIES: 1-deoxy-D-xylulose-5-phosphate reductoisomerase [Corynebacterium]NJJ02854.1 1-deoxy-D-xylulose-5-phosphate reductoisomerase [Corynebacterium coyleae]OFT70116.1 1-deoxy-D-xylulose-5-phosphate reductoisomerase [Corynebacterium sp. HMSC05C01]OHO81776.1 1-deoxy-D-xylulose-5-phosphate reductoisomerase [Corynebacterium sp. HMSC036E10]UBI10087.1 1-deoxy-D-xylulose-5-phosphate reductoisomerase [Corynebacterium coyleae]